MRTKPIRRDEIRFDGRYITALPINSVRKGKDGLEPIKKLWVPLLRAINEKEKKQHDDWVRRGLSSPEFEPVTLSLHGRHYSIYCAPQETVCRHCGRSFYRLHRVGYYCSDKCAKDVHKVFVAKAVKVRSEYRAAERAKWNSECETCGKPIKAQRSTMRFCSIRCRVAAHRL